MSRVGDHARELHDDALTWTPAKIEPTSFPVFEPPEDMPTPEEIKARNAFHCWNMRKTSRWSL